jgi:hypothetical protein
MMRWAGNVAHLRAIRKANKMLLRKRIGKRSLEDISTDGKIILKWILGK